MIRLASVGKLEAALTLHMQIEEQLVYPLIAKIGNTLRHAPRGHPRVDVMVDLSTLEPVDRVRTVVRVEAEVRIATAQ